MDYTHFIFNKGLWIGEGKISFTETKEHLKFYTRWSVEAPDNVEDEGAVINCVQKVEIQGAADHVINQLTFSEISHTKFDITLENELVKDVTGTGFFDAKRIAWEFRGHSSFEGFEVYDLQDNGDYLFHAEYVSPDQIRSVIEGRIWRKATT
jgi:hypothetical protein